MTFTFRPAVRENVQILMGIAGGTGSGKTFSAMKVASGLAGGKRFAVIDTENGRARHYADFFEFDVCDLGAPFTPARYTEALTQADAADYPVILIDSVSHEHEGDGGLLDMHEAEFQRMGGRESVKIAAWIKPKTEHKAFVQALLRCKAHVIMCFRAAEKIEIAKVDGKTKIVPKESPVGADGWLPIAEKNLPYEMTISVLLKAGAPGVPIPIKLQEQHRGAVPLDRPLSEETGRALAEWSRGSAARLNRDEAVIRLLGLIRETGTLDGLKALWAEVAKLDAADAQVMKAAFTKRKEELAAASSEPGSEG